MGCRRLTRQRAMLISTMLRSMLSFRPENWPTAKQVLESEWMVKWALPESEKIRSTDRQVPVNVN